MAILILACASASDADDMTRAAASATHPTAFFINDPPDFVRVSLTEFIRVGYARPSIREDIHPQRLCPGGGSLCSARFHSLRRSARSETGSPPGRAHPTRDGFDGPTDGMDRR